MNLKGICQEILVIKLEDANVKVRDIVEKELQPWHGKISVQFEQNGAVRNHKFLVRYPERYHLDNMKSKVFERIYSKEKLVHAILGDFQKIIGASLSPEMLYISEKFIIYNADQKLHRVTRNREEELTFGLVELAKFHAAGIAYTKSDSRDKLYDIQNLAELNEGLLNFRNMEQFSNKIFAHVLKLRDKYRNTFLDDILQQRIFKEMYNIMSGIKNLGFIKTLIVGNFTCDTLSPNLHDKIVDFSSAVYNFPLYDVLQFILSFPTDQGTFEKSVNFYYKALGEEMKKYRFSIEELMPFEAFVRSYNLIAPFMNLMLKLRVIDENPTNYSPNKLLEILNILNLIKVNVNEQEICFEDCYEVFNKIARGDCKLISYGTSPQKVKNGFLGEHYDMHIEVEKQDQIYVYCLFLKGIPHTEALDEFEKEVGSFFKETMFYTRYVPLLRQHHISILENVLPICYFADEYKYIALDDLTQKGFLTLSPRNPMDLEVVEANLIVLAKLHASCLILEEIIGGKIGKTYRLIDDFRREFNETFYSSVPIVESHKNAGRGGMEALAELVDFPDVDREEFKRLAVNSCNQQNEFAKPSQTWRNTICHADYWTKNFMIKYDNNDKLESLVMIDFQTYRYAPPAQDLLGFIYLNTDSEMRNQYLEGWLEMYYRQFSMCLQYYGVVVDRVLKKPEFYDSCKFYKQFAINQSITHFQVILAPTEILAPMLLNQNMARKIFCGNRYDLVKEIWEKDEVYRRKLTEAVLLLKDYLMAGKTFQID